MGRLSQLRQHRPAVPLLHHLCSQRWQFLATNISNGALAAIDL
jgi:hypothetical protein